MAAQGLRIGLIDTDFELPELHLPFRLENAALSHHLNDVLWRELPFDQAVVNVSAALPAPNGALYLLPASSQPEDISAALRTPLKMDIFNDTLERFCENFQLDYVVIDSSTGLEEKTMSLLALADDLLVLLRPDQQEYQGTALLVDVGNRLNIPNVFVVANQVGEKLDRTSIKDEIRRVFHSECVAIIPHHEILAVKGKDSLLIFSQPGNPISLEILQLARLFTTRNR
jgi:MinD-like ATPase involved in chromosome partitioning or flagellar assembly